MAWGRLAQDRSDYKLFSISPTKYHPTLYNDLSRVEGGEWRKGQGDGVEEGNLMGKLLR